MFEKLVEEKVTPGVLKHMTHSEDLVFFGDAGCNLIINTYEDIFEALKGNTPKSKIAVKWDGSPAVVLATDFNGETFVALKHSWDKGKRFHTFEEIDTEYGEERASVSNKLKILLKYAPYINIPQGEAWMGDILFAKEDLRKETLDGEECITFQPNTIVYAVPEEDAVAKTIMRAELGVVWHTKYKGSFEQLQLGFDVDISQINQLPEIYQIDANLPNVAGIINMTEEETQKTSDLIDQIKNDLENLQHSDTYKIIVEDDKLKVLIQTYSNSMIRKNSQDFTAESFIEWFSKKCDEEKEKKKTDKGKLAVEQRKNAVIESLSDLNILFQVQKKIAVLKEFFVNKLNNFNKVRSYVLHNQQGYLPTSGEGFAVSDIEGNVQKLVSRLEFSRNNFSPDIIKGWTSDKREAQMQEAKLKEDEKVKLDNKYPELDDAVEDNILKTDLDIKKVNSGPTYKDSSKTYNLNMNVMPSAEKGGKRAQAIADFAQEAEKNPNMNVTTRKAGTTPVADIQLKVGDDDIANITANFKDRPGVETKGQEEMWGLFIYNELNDIEQPSDDELKEKGFHASWRNTFVNGAKKAVEFLGKKNYIISREEKTFPEGERSSFNDVDTFYRNHKKDFFVEVSDKNSWNPSDLYACEKGYEEEFARILAATKTLQEANDYLRECIANKKVVGISLKELSFANARLECVNFTEDGFETAGKEVFTLGSFQRKISSAGDGQFNVPALSITDKDMSGLKFMVTSEDGTVAKFDYRNFTGGPGASGFQMEGLPIPAKAKWSKVPVSVIYDIHRTFNVSTPSFKSSIEEAKNLNSLNSMVEEISNSGFTIKSLGGIELNTRSWLNFVDMINKTPDAIKGTSIWMDDSHGTLFQWGRVLRMLLIFTRAKQQGSLDTILNKLVNSCQKIGENFAPFIKIY